MKVVIHGKLAYICPLLAITVLETIELYTIRRLWDMVEPSGYAESSCYVAVRVLKFAEAISAKGIYRLTERGKIMLALLRGKQIRRSGRKRKRSLTRAGNPHGMGPRAAEFAPPGH